MIALNKLKFENIRSIPDPGSEIEFTGPYGSSIQICPVDPNETDPQPRGILIVGRVKDRFDDRILATYSKQKGLDPYYDLESVLTGEQYEKIKMIIAEHKQGGNHGEYE